MHELVKNHLIVFDLESIILIILANINNKYYSSHSCRVFCVFSMI